MKEDLLKIINYYGVNSQLRKFNEEVFELNEAVINRELHWGYDTEIQDIRPLNEHIAEEIADVLVVVNQFIYYYGLDENSINKIMKYKINRQLERIKEE